MDIKKNMTADNDCLMYRPFQSESENLNIKRDHYSTSLDPRGYIPVYEYNINNTPIMWDRETGYVHFTGIWKALGNSKSDIVKMVDSNPELGTKKIRGGFLRIQGTWIPYDYAHILCKRTAWTIRKELIPIFGQGFTTEALHPDHPDYGCLLLDPKNLPANGKNSSQHKRNTMRQNNKPYCKRINTPKIRTPKPMKNSNYLKKKHRQQQEEQEQQQQKEEEEQEKERKMMISASMSVNRLLNDEDEDDILSSEEEFDDDDEDEDDMMTDDNGSSTSSSTSSLSSPTFRVVQTYPPEQWSNSVPLLPPIYNTNHSTTTPTHIAQDIIDTISATILLQRLSQDDGARPFKPFESSSVIPSKVIVGHQEFTICWD